MKISIAALASLITGRGFCPFSDVHAAAEHVLGHPVWTHEFAEKALWTRLREAVLAQHPDLVGIDAICADVTRDNWRDVLIRIEAEYGTEREVAKGGETRTESPLASLERVAPGKPKIVVSL